MNNATLAKLRILGCGTSTGVPVPACNCSVCKSGDPLNQRTRTSALVQLADGSNILIDASTDLRYQALRYQVERIDAVVFTHSHADHILGLDDLRPFNFGKKAPIPCFGTSETLSDLRRMFKYVFEPDQDYEGGLLPQLELRQIDYVSPFEVLGQAIRPFKLMHGRTAVAGFRFGDLAYATDCNAIPEESAQTLAGVKTLILDGLRDEPHRTHFTLTQAATAARNLGPQQTFLVHMTHSVDYHQASKKLPPGVMLAYDGLEIPFSW